MSHDKVLEKEPFVNMLCTLTALDRWLLLQHTRLPHNSMASSVLFPCMDRAWNRPFFSHSPLITNLKVPCSIYFRYKCKEGIINIRQVIRKLLGSVSYI